LGDAFADDGSVSEAIPRLQKTVKWQAVARGSFADAAGPAGEVSSAENYLPFFSCKAVGDVLIEAAQSYPTCQILVLCGHTHVGGAVRVLANLQVLTGPAEYGRPEIQRVFQVE